MQPEIKTCPVDSYLERVLATIYEERLVKECQNRIATAMLEMQPEYKRLSTGLDWMKKQGSSGGMEGAMELMMYHFGPYAESIRETRRELMDFSTEFHATHIAPLTA